MVATLAYELHQAVIDPSGAGWAPYRDTATAAANTCAWDFGTTQSDVDGRNASYQWNVQGVGGSRFLVPSTYDPVAQSCVLQRAAPINVYLVFYGDWGERTGMSVFKNFVSSLSDTSVDAPSVASWWRITAKNNDSSNQRISAQVGLGRRLGERGTRTGW